MNTSRNKKTRTSKDRLIEKRVIWNTSEGTPIVWLHQNEMWEYLETAEDRDLMSNEVDTEGWLE